MIVDYTKLGETAKHLMRTISAVISHNYDTIKTY